ncbi:hypothetical protein KI387_019985, partial [Taxus chinensis]
MRSFVLAVRSNIVIVGEEDEKEEHGHRISVLCSGWDSELHRFFPPRKWSIPLSGLSTTQSSLFLPLMSSHLIRLNLVTGNTTVVAAESVATYENGEIEPYILLAGSSSLAMALLDISRHKFTIVAQLEYHREDSSPKIECLLTNGPTAIASLPGKIFVMYPHHVRDSHHDKNENKTVEPLWNAYVLNIDEVHLGADVRLLFAHDGNTACTPEAVLGIRNVSKDIISHQQ